MEENNNIILPAAASPPLTDKEDYHPTTEDVRQEERGGGDGGSCGGKREANHGEDEAEVGDGMLEVSPPPGFSSSLLASCVKRGRGRPRGTGRLQLLASLGGFAAETAGGIFIPHVITVDPGEDIVSKISSFAQRGSRAVCILSATGVVSSVVIRQPVPSGELFRYEGCFEILSLSGSFTFNETSGARRKICVLTVSLAKPDGRVFGGSVVGCLIASGPIQLIVASFKQNISKEIKLRQLAESSSCSLLGNPETVKLPIQIPGIRDGDQENNYTTQTAAVSACRNDEACNRIIVNQLLKPVAENGGGRTGFQSPQHMSDQEISADINVCNPQI